MAEPTDRKELIAELDAARSALAGYGRAIRHDLDFGHILKRSFRRHAPVWFGGAAIVGLLLSRLPARRQKVVMKTPLFGGAKKAEKAGVIALALPVLKFALDFAKPAMLRWFKSRYFDAPVPGPRR